MIASALENQSKVRSMQIGQLMVCLSELPITRSPDHREMENQRQVHLHVEEEEHRREVPS